jgi:hypothetical protein
MDRGTVRANALHWFYIVPALGAEDLLPSFAQSDALENVFSSIFKTVGVTIVRKSFM